MKPRDTTCAAQPDPRKGSARDYRPPEPRRVATDAERAENERRKMQHEISEWNRRVEYEKAVKKAKKLARRNA